MKTYTYILFWLNEKQELQEAGYTKFADAMHAYDLIDGRCVMQKFYGDDFVKNVMSK